MRLSVVTSTVGRKRSLFEPTTNGDRVKIPSKWNFMAVGFINCREWRRQIRTGPLRMRSSFMFSQNRNSDGWMWELGEGEGGIPTCLVTSEGSIGAATLGRAARTFRPRTDAATISPLSLSDCYNQLTVRTSWLLKLFIVGLVMRISNDNISCSSYHHTTVNLKKSFPKIQHDAVFFTTHRSHHNEKSLHLFLNSLLMIY